MRENWTPVTNIYLDFPGYDCFVCSPNHEWGFKLEFFHDPDEDAVVSPVACKEAMAGYPGILHGGFQAMLMDEAMGWAAKHFLKKIVFTARLEVKFLRPVPTSGELLVYGRIVKQGKRLARAEAWLACAGERLGEAHGAFFIPNREEFIRSTGSEEIPERFLPMLRT